MEERQVPVGQDSGVSVDCRGGELLGDFGLDRVVWSCSVVRGEIGTSTTSGNGPGSVGADDCDGLLLEVAKRQGVLLVLQKNNS